MFKMKNLSLLLSSVCISSLLPLTANAATSNVAISAATTNSKVATSSAATNSKVTTSTKTTVTPSTTKKLNSKIKLGSSEYTYCNYMYESGGYYCGSIVFPDDTSTTYKASASTVLMSGSSGEGVKLLQAVLNNVDNAGLDVDGQFGSSTKSALIEFQQNHGLDGDGICGSETWDTLYNAIP